MSNGVRFLGAVVVASAMTAGAGAAQTAAPTAVPTLAPSSVPAARGSGVPYKVRVNIDGKTLERILASPSPHPAHTPKPTPRPSGATPPYEVFGSWKT